VILAGDVGATKILLEVGEARSDRWEPVFERRYPLADFENMDGVLATFLEEWNRHHREAPLITEAAFGAAGPAMHNKVKMTHRPWILDGAHIAKALGIPHATVVNDLDAAANGLPWLAPNDMTTLQLGMPAQGAPQVVLGVGTGLGIAYIVDGKVIPGEGGHAGFSPASTTQAALFDKLAATHGRVEAEEVASGMGLANIHKALTGETRAPAEITERAGKGDRTALNVLELFAECLGNVAGDHALSVMARGGVYLAGGVIAKIAPLINISRFASAFCAKGAFSSVLMEIPVRVVTNENLAVIGAARIASRRKK
jgi:glucokinase